jgi:hypothetical protein
MGVGTKFHGRLFVHLSSSLEILNPYAISKYLK